MSCSLNENSVGINSNFPDSHYLEKLGDAEPVNGVFSLAQPLIEHIYNTRQAEESLMKWCDIPGSYYDL